MYKRKYSGEPCRMPAGIASSDFAPLKSNLADRFWRKPCSQLMISTGNRRILRLCISHLWWTLLKAPATSRKTAEKTLSRLNMFKVRPIESRSHVQVHHHHNMKSTLYFNKSSIRCISELLPNHMPILSKLMVLFPILKIFVRLCHYLRTFAQKIWESCGPLNLLTVPK
jgi:hypothetical protein